MNCSWHPINYPCPKCGVELAILWIAASSDGELLVGLVCASCATQVSWQATFSQLMQRAMYKDIEKALAENCGNRPLRPPLLEAPVPPPQPNPDKDFDEFMHNIGADKPEGDDDDLPQAP